MWRRSSATPTKKGNFLIGYTREQGHPLSLDLKRLVQRSSGIFGATGTGKSFLTRLILAGLIQANETSVLIFDMHNEYGPDDIASDTGQRIPGCAASSRHSVRMVGLGRSATIRGQAPDFNLEIAQKDIQPADIELLTRELNLKETTPTTLDALVSTTLVMAAGSVNFELCAWERDCTTKMARVTRPPTASKPGRFRQGSM